MTLSFLQVRHTLVWAVGALDSESKRNEMFVCVCVSLTEGVGVCSTISAGIHHSFQLIDEVSGQ